MSFVVLWSFLFIWSLVLLVVWVLVLFLFFWSFVIVWGFVRWLCVVWVCRGVFWVCFWSRWLFWYGVMGCCLSVLCRLWILCGSRVWGWRFWLKICELRIRCFRVFCVFIVFVSCWWMGIFECLNVLCWVVVFGVGIWEDIVG